MATTATEARHALAKGLHAVPAAEALARLLAGQREAAAAVGPALPAIEAAVRVAVRVLADGGRLAYAGAGSAGVMALSDALELAGTFGIPADRTPVLLAGGAATLLAMRGGVEDSIEDAARDVAAADLGGGDAVIAVSASGSTPYTVTTAEVARARGAAVIGIANVPGSPLLLGADVPVLLETGAEVVAGSTRMGAATAQKIALNLLSTAVGLGLGHVHDGFMVNVVADNAKLRDRAARIVAELAGVAVPDARAALEQTEGAVKAAVLLAVGAGDAAAADRLLAASRGHLGPALDALRNENQTGPGARNTREKETPCD